MEIVWRNVFGWICVHVMGLYGSTLLLDMKLKTGLWLVITLWMTAMGVTAGVHRLWTHRAYKAKLPLRLFLAFCNTLAGESSIYIWVRDHMTHHKGSDTDSDPYNASRGFFFSHMGWLMVKKHPDVIKTGSTIDLSDLQADPVVMFQHKYYVPSVILLCFLLPTLIPVLCWEESLHVAFFIAMFRYIFSLHPVWLVNSAAHMYGNRPYDTKIAPADNFLVAFLGFGGGFHNFHHTFPYDYRASEWGNFINPTKVFIDLMAFVGLAYDLKTASEDLIAHRVGTGEEKRNFK